MPVVNCEPKTLFNQGGDSWNCCLNMVCFGEIITVVLAIAAIAAIIVNVAQRNKRQRGELRVNNLSEQYKEMKKNWPRR